MINQAKQILERYWGYQDFRSPQEEVIASLLDGEDTIALLPTGAGKSICYQVPAILCEGLCIVISPLLALIKDQVTNLNKRYVRACYLSSDQSVDQQILVYDALKNKEVDLLYVAPERLTNIAFLEVLSQIKISFIAVDEAHCISEWGNDFRPSYQGIKDFRARLSQKAPCIALTATATEKVLEDIVSKIGMQKPTIFKKSFKRDNIHINLVQAQDKIAQLERVLKEHQGSGIVYCRTRKETEYVCQTLKAKGLDVDFFHAGLHPSTKQKRQNDWTMSTTKVLVSTNAFGMGIDKENVRVVVHYNPSYSIENYYQEIGRAGRDGKESYAYMLWTEQDLSDSLSEIKNTLPSQEEYERVISGLYSSYGVGMGDKLESFYEFDFTQFQAKVKVHRLKIFTILEYLNNISYLNWRFEPSESWLQMRFPIEQLDGYFFGKDKMLIESISRKLAGIFYGRVKFSEKKLAEALRVPQENLHALLEKYSKLKMFDYIDGAKHSIEFLKPRNDKALLDYYWKLFKAMQEHKLKKVKELHYFIENKKYCRMRLILGYFNEKSSENCKKCDICNASDIDVKAIQKQVYSFLKQPRKTEEVYAKFPHISRDILHEILQNLVEEEKIQAINYNTFVAR